MMKLDIRKANQRGRGDHGWLKSWHTFSFANYHDPAQMGFSDLLVINDDRVAPGMGFGTHGHRDMEIFSYVLEGELAHKDSMGTGAVIKPGDVQMMSAGSGIQHSEFNPSKENGVHFLQIWIVPNRGGVTPRYQQQHFTREQKAGKLTAIITDEVVSNGDTSSLNVYQAAKVFAGCFDGAEQASYALSANRFAYIHVARGSVALNGVALEAGDGVRVREAGELTFSAGSAAEVLLFDLRPIESPR